MGNRGFSLLSGWPILKALSQPGSFCRLYFTLSLDWWLMEDPQFWWVCLWYSFCFQSLYLYGYLWRIFPKLNTVFFQNFFTFAQLNQVFSITLTPIYVYFNFTYVLKKLRSEEYILINIIINPTINLTTNCGKFFFLILIEG